MTTQSMPIDEGEVHVWLAYPGRVVDPDSLATLEAVLSAQELDRMGRFRFARDRDIFRASHALVRMSLSQYEPIEPVAWRFTSNEQGRPELDTAHNSRLRFNLSHTVGMAVCAVALDRSIGVDVETTDRRIDISRSLEHYLAPLERDELRELPTHEQGARFFAYWTLKEAYIKARGLGLAIPLDEFAFRLYEDGQVSIEFVPGFDDDPDNWQFSQRWLTNTHSLSVAIPRSGADLEVVVRPALGPGFASGLGG